MDRRLTITLAFTVVLAGLFWVDPLYIPLLLLGPVVTGAVAGGRGWVREAAAAWAGACLIALVTDWVLNNEDQLFHLATAVYTSALVAGIGVATRAVGRRRALRTA